MSWFHNKVAKKYIIVCCVITAFFVGILATVTVLEGRYYKKEVNVIVSNMIGAIKTQFPEADEEILIQILNGEDYSDIGYQELSQYGIQKNDYVAFKMQHFEKKMAVINGLILMIAVFIVIFLFVLYLKNRQKNLNDLTSYVNKVSKGDYRLEMQENTEDELSSLKNELYKVTVMLNESAKLSRSQKEMLSVALSDISHQIKTPLTSISILLDNLLESETIDEQTRNKFLNQIVHQVSSINWMIVSLLKLSKLDAGGIEFEKRDIRLQSLLQEVVLDIELIAELREAQIVISCPEHSMIQGDYKWNKEAILNIVKNAVEHTIRGGKVFIQVHDNSVYTEITIRDQGSGISEEDRKHIFERFYKTEHAVDDSTGIGLSLAYAIIKKQNGYITVESETDKGTAFIIKCLKTK